MTSLEEKKRDVLLWEAIIVLCLYHVLQRGHDSFYTLIIPMFCKVKSLREEGYKVVIAFLIRFFVFFTGCSRALTLVVLSWPIVLFLGLMSTRRPPVHQFDV